MTWSASDACAHECAKDLSNWVLETGSCKIVGAKPKLQAVHPDPNAGLVGVKWELAIAEAVAGLPPPFTRQRQAGEAPPISST